MKIRYIWLVFLVAALGFAYVFFKYSENNEIGGIKIVSAQKLEEITQGLSYVEKPENAGELIKLQGQNIAFDSEKQTYYVSQIAGSEDFEAVFQTNKDCRYYIEGGDWGELDDAMYDGKALRVWIVDSDIYTICNMIFTGAPVMALYTDDMMSAVYGNGECALFDPDDEEVHGMSVKNSKALIKHNPKADTYSVKLMKKNFDEEKKLSFLGIGKNNNWKLYKVSENDGTLMKAMLAADVWNMINEGTNLTRTYRLVELMVNGSYKGVYLLAPKWTVPYLGLDNGWTLAKSEDIGQAETDRLSKDIDLLSLGRYALFLQTTYAYANAADDYIIVYNESESGGQKYMLVPDKIEYAFGSFNNKLNYMGLGDISNISGLMLESEAMLPIQDCYTEEVFRISSELWQELRKNELSDNNLLKIIRGYREYIIASGLHVRCVKRTAFGYHYDRLEEYMLQRMKYLDEYYMFSGEGGND